MDYFESLSDVVMISEALKPDMAIFTSIGMTFWGVILSNLRLALLQIQLPGHPATTYNENIDFFLFDRVNAQ